MCLNYFQKRQIRIRNVYFNVKLYTRSDFLAFSNALILFRGTSWILCVHGPVTRLCNQWLYTYFSLTHITQKHTHILNYPSLEHIVNLSHVWQTQHLSDPQPHLSYVCVSVFVICARLWCMCVMWKSDRERVWLRAQAISFIKKWGTAAQQKIRTGQGYDKV